MPKLALLTAPGGPIDLAEFPLSDPAPGTAALKLRMAGICGSDLHICRGELPLPCPFAMCHEMVGEVTELGASVLVYGNKSVGGVMFYDPVTPATGLSFLQHTGFPFHRLLPRPLHLADINAALAAADAGSVPRGALVP